MLARATAFLPAVVCHDRAANPLGRVRRHWRWMRFEILTRSAAAISNPTQGNRLSTGNARASSYVMVSQLEESLSGPSAGPRVCFDTRIGTGAEHASPRIHHDRRIRDRAAILCEGAPIDPDHLTLQSGAKALRDDTTDLSALERTTIAKVLEDCRGNKRRPRGDLVCRARRFTFGFESIDSRKP